MSNKPTDYLFDLPPERIAKEPVHPREAARLLLWPEADTSKTFADLPGLLQTGDVLVFNNSRVIPARLYATRGDMTTELLLHRPMGDFTRWQTFAHKMKRLKPDQILDFGHGMQAEIVARHEHTLEIVFKASHAEVEAFLESYGEIPLPPYIEREQNAQDKIDYQTVYAKDKGSVAAPTAGLHFSEELLAALKTRGVELLEVTLHVGAGTFQPLYPQLDDIRNHKMHSEFGIVTPEVAAKLVRAKAEGRRVIAVGTTSLRLLESAALEGSIKPFMNDTAIYITPGFEFKVVDGLITNFHLPQSTLLILVAAFVGFEEMHALYKLALRDGLRFYSYGDGSLLWKKR